MNKLQQRNNQFAIKKLKSRAFNGIPAIIILVLSVIFINIFNWSIQTLAENNILNLNSKTQKTYQLPKNKPYKLQQITQYSTQYLNNLYQ